MFKSLEYQNFEPSPTLNIYGHRALSQISHFVPEQFTSRAKISRKGERYKVHLEIYSRYGLFIEESSSTDPYLAIDRGARKLKEQATNFLKLRKAHQTLNAELIGKRVPPG